MTHHLFATPAIPNRKDRMPSVKSTSMKDLSRLQKAQDAVDLAKKNYERAIVARDKELVTARKDNWPWPPLLKITRLTRQGAQTAALRANGGETPVPSKRTAPEG